MLMTNSTFLSGNQPFMKPHKAYHPNFVLGDTKRQKVQKKYLQ
jgi:hypothetical protein